MPTYSHEGKTYTLSELRFLFPSVSLPASLSETDLAALGVTLVPDAEPTPGELLAGAKATRLALLSERFAVAEREGHFLSSFGFEVDANETANRNVTGLVTQLEATGTDDTLFCDYGNAMRTVTLEQLKALRLEIIMYGQMLYARKWTLRERIEAAETVEAVNAVEIEFDTLPAPSLS